MTLTLSIDDRTLERARAAAHAMGKDLDQLVREYVERLAGPDDAERLARRFRELSGRGRSEPGWKFDREAFYDLPRSDR